MTAVWYIGSSDTRTITSAQWTAAGAPGATATWDASNGFSLPAGLFTVDQLAVMAANGDFNTEAPNGPRPGDAIINRDLRHITSADLINLGLTPVDEETGVFGRAENVTNIATAVSNNPVAILGCSLYVPPTKRNVILRAGLCAKVTTPPVGKNGFLNTIIYDTTAVGTPTIVAYGTTPIRTTDVAADWVGTTDVEVQIGPSSIWRKYQLYTNASVNPGGTAHPVLSVPNATYQPSWIEGEAA